MAGGHCTALFIQKFMVLSARMRNDWVEAEIEYDAAMEVVNKVLRRRETRDSWIQTAGGKKKARCSCSGCSSRETTGARHAVHGRRSIMRTLLFTCDGEVFD